MIGSAREGYKTHTLSRGRSQEHGLEKATGDAIEIRNKMVLRIDELEMKVDRMLEVLSECDEYLTDNPEGTYIGKGSILHQKISKILHNETI